MLCPAQDFPEALLLLSKTKRCRRVRQFWFEEKEQKEQEKIACPLFFIIQIFSVFLLLLFFLPSSLLPPSISGHSPGEQLKPLDKHTLYMAGGMPSLLPYWPSFPPSWSLLRSSYASHCPSSVPFLTVPSSCSLTSSPLQHPFHSLEDNSVF